MISTLLSKIRQQGPNDVQQQDYPAPSASQERSELTNTLPCVEIPDEFLTTKAPDAQPFTKTRIEFENTKLPEYAGSYAVIIDNALSPQECSRLLGLAEASAGVRDRGWEPAMVSAGGNHAFVATNYRNSDRIVWDSTEIADRIWKRCLEVQGIQEELTTIESNPSIQGEIPAKLGERWIFTRLNERLRFLKYSPGHFFGSHCDGSYRNPDKSKKERSHFTLHLYLNDDGIEGGATPFHSIDGSREVKVDAKLGRILLFQQRGLLHSGEEVRNGTKYTMRTDLMFKRIPHKDKYGNDVSD